MWVTTFVELLLLLQCPVYCLFFGLDTCIKTGIEFMKHKARLLLELPGSKGTKKYRHGEHMSKRVTRCKIANNGLVGDGLQGLRLDILNM